MSIDLMREKGVYNVVNDVVSPMGDFSHSDSEPIWRQNGYQLRFDADSNDYLTLDSNKTLLNDGDYLEFSFTLPSLTLSNNQTLVSEGNTGDYLTILSSNNNLFIFTGTGDTLSTLNVNQLENTIRITRTSTGLDVTLNGVTETSTLTTDFNFNQFFRLSSFYTSNVLNKVEFLGETFDFSESTGNTITGNLGTVATINTSDSGGTEYIDEFVWEKKSFALDFNADNQEYLTLDSVKTLSNDGDYLEFSFTLPSLTFSNNQTLVSEGNTGDYLTILSSNNNLFIFTGTGDTLSTLTVTELENNIRITRTLTGLVVTLNGVTETSTLTTNFNFNQFFRLSSFYTSTRLNKIEFLGETFNLTEGLGNKVYSTPNDIEGTINTTASEGIERINFGMWLKGNDTDGWTPYTI